MRSKNWDTITLLLLILSSVNVFAQSSRLRFQDLSKETGLLPSINTSIFQDSKGFIWIGAYGGLAKYDGRDYSYFTHEPSDSNSLTDSKISAIVEDSSGYLWVGTQYGLNRMDPKTQSFKQYIFEDQAHNMISALYVDINGDVWISTAKGLKKYDSKRNEIQTFSHKALPLEFYSDWTGPVIRDHLGVLWIGSINGLIAWDQSKDEMTIYRNDPDDLSSIDYNDILSLFEDHEKQLWIGTRRGLNRFKRNTGTFKRYKVNPKGKGSITQINHISEKKEGGMWLGSFSGLFSFDPTSQSFSRNDLHLSDGTIVESPRINCFLVDRTGNIWVGANTAGIYMHNPNTRRFINYYGNQFDEVIGVMAVREPYEIKPSNLLLWKGEKGLMQLDYQTGTYTPFPYQPKEGLSYWNNGITCIRKDRKERLWFGTASGGVFVFDPVTTSFQHHLHIEKDSLSISGNYIRDILIDARETVWVATLVGGVSRFNDDEGTWERFLQKEQDLDKRYSLTRTIYEDRSGDIWVGSRGGLHHFDRATSTFKHYEHEPGNGLSMSESTVFDIYEDRTGNFWIATYGGGLNLLDRSEDTFTHFTRKDGLPNNTILSIMPDRRDNLWLTTFNGLVFFDTNAGKFKAFDRKDGLSNASYNAFGYYKSPYSGHIIAEGDGGMDIFHPDSIFTDTTLPSISFTNFKLSNQEVPIRNEGSIQDSVNKYYLPGHISTLEKVVLPHHQKVISFEFAALHFANPKKNQYAYKLEGFDEDWQEIGRSNAATFTNLDPGSYILRVKASNGDGIWNEEGISMALIITPPWWETWWAYGLYWLLLSLLLIAIYRYQRRRWQLQTALRLEQQEAGKLKELDILKTNLYTNITHEFRTPLTVVLGLSKIVQEKLATLSATKIIDHLQTIDRNSRSLLKLVNQMLDLSKIEAGKLQANYIQSDIISYLNSIVDSLTHYAKSNKIEIHVIHEFATHHMDFDPEKLEQVINNILSNAIKFTPAGGHIYLLTNVQEEIAQFHIKIKDTGLGIPAEEIPHIFNRFYQIEQSSTRQGEGTGIGLALTKELLNLMQGQILVESEIDSGSMFEVILPINRVASIQTTTGLSSVSSNPLQAEARSKVPSIESHKEIHLSEESKPLVLLVEDNIDVRFYVREILTDQFQIEEAQDGQEGIDKAIERIPDLIITDIMMPKKDGLELCMTLKEDERTSHIPIVMLTAKADLDSRLAGLSTGANAYLSKPFSREELLLRLNNLLTWGKKLKERYQGITPDSSITVANAALEVEDAFVKKVREAIESHLSDVEFSAEELAKQVYLSRTQVHRKLKALTGKSTGQFIHTVRLHHALNLLKETDMSITQIAYEAGYKEVSYFSRLFAEEFGKTASLIRKQL